MTHFLSNISHNTNNIVISFCIKAIRFSKYQLFEMVLCPVWSKSIIKIKKSQRDGVYSLRNITTGTFHLITVVVKFGISLQVCLQYCILNHSYRWILWGWLDHAS